MLDMSDDPVLTGNASKSEFSQSSGIFHKLRDTAHHTVYFGIASVLGRSLNFLLLPVYTGYLTDDQYGALSLLLLLQAFMSLFPNSVFIFPLFRSYYDYPESDTRARSLVVSTSFWLITALSFVLCGAGWLFSSYVSLWLIGTPDYTTSVQLVFLACFFECLGLPSFTVFRARKRSKAYAAVATFSMLVQATLSVALVVVFHQGVWGIMLGIVLGIVLRTLLGILMTLETLSLRVSLHEVVKMLLYGLPFLPGNIFSYVNRSSDRVFLTHLLDLGVQGVFSVGLRFAQIVSVLIFIPFNFIRPAAIFDSEKDHDATHFYSRMLTYLVFLGLFLSLGVSALAPEALRVMTGPKYWSAWTVVPLLSLSYLFDGIRHSISPGLLLKRKTALMSLAEAIGTVVNVILMLLLVRSVGSFGASLALAITYFVVCAVLLFFNHWHLPVPWEWMRLTKLFLTAAALYFFTLFLPLPGLWTAFTVKFLICLTFPLLLWLIRFYEPVELLRIHDTLMHMLSRLRNMPARILRRLHLRFPA